MRVSSHNRSGIPRPAPAARPDRRLPINDQSRPLAVLVGADKDARPTLRWVLAAAGWQVRERSVVRPLIPVALWGDVALVIVLGSGGDDALAQLEGLYRAGYEGPFVLLAPAPSMNVRRRAFAQGAYDVIGLPTDGRQLEVRLRAVLRTLHRDVTPSAL